MKINQKLRRKMSTLMLTGAFILGAALPTSCGTQEAVEKEGETTAVQDTRDTAANAETAVNNRNEEDTNTVYMSDNNEESDKTETVYAKADAQGNVSEVTVEVDLKNTGGEAIVDYSELADIKNTKGDEEFTEKEKGIILWENHGEDIRYEGRSQAKLPIGVHITYYLDGKEIMPAALAGKSGQVRIRFDYENLTSEDINIDGRTISVQIPYVVCSALFLPSDKFENIKITNGKMIDLEEQQIVLGYAMPGLSKSLKLADYEPTADMEIPEYVEIIADVTDFELDFTATIISNGLFNDMDMDSLDDADDLAESMEELADASDKLVDGSAELAEGAGTFGGYLNDYMKGVRTVNEGAKALKDGLTTMNKEKASLEQGARSLQAGLEELEGALDDFGMLDGSLGTGVEDMITSGGEIDMTAVTSMVEILEDLSENLSQIDLRDMEHEAGEQARQQADAALAEALEETSLTEEEKAAIRERVMAGIDLSGSAAKVQEQLEAIQSQAEAIHEQAEAIQGRLEALQQQLEAAGSYIDAIMSMSEQFSRLGDVFAQFKMAVEGLSSGSSQLTEGVRAFNEGIEQLDKGAEALYEGTSQLADAGAELNEGFDGLLDGTEALSDGICEFDIEGIQELSKLAGDDLQNVLLGLRALKEADGSYDNFSGIGEGMKGSVRFIIETEEIK